MEPIPVRMGEIGGKKRIGIIIVAVLVAAAIAAVAWKALHAKDVAKNAAALTPSTIPTTQPVPPPEPTTSPPIPPVATVKPPTPAAARDDGDEPAAKPAHAPAAKKHVVAKKPKGKKPHR